MRVLVLGGSGMLGTDMVRELQCRKWDIVAPTRGQLDIEDPESVAQVAASKFGELQWCVNCAAYTAVDKAESEPQKAHELNAISPGYLARACALGGVKLLHISTDFVFDGTAAEPYKEEAPTNPLGAYGRTKLEGERAVLEANPNAIVLRTAWLYGPNGHSFPRTIIRAWEAGKELKVVSDQVGNPTYTADLARVIADMLERNAFPGIYHAAGPEAMSWHQFAMTVVDEHAKAVGEEPGIVKPIFTHDWPTPAKRPPYSVLSFEKLASLGIKPMRPVRDAVKEFVQRLLMLEAQASPA